jgi:peroxiredoxin
MKFPLRSLGHAFIISLLAGATVAMRFDDRFTLEPRGAVTARIGYFPVPMRIVPTKPSQVKKEPTYQATPKYGIIKLGDGPKSEYVVALDEPEKADWKIYIDRNQNGDLTDDGDGAWNKKSDTNGRVMYGVLEVPLRASYGTATKETSSADYTLGIYSFVGRPAPFTYRQSSRVGTVTLNGKPHKAILVENDADALFSKPVATVADAGKTRAVWLQVDINDDGKYASGLIDIRAPFKLGDATYEATVAKDGSTVTLAPTTKPVLELTPKSAAAAPLLKSGATAPDFTAEKWGGGSIKLSDYRGKVVVLDFWATWCGPCIQSMPHIEAVNKAVKGQDVVVLGLCVFDEKQSYEAWVPKNKDKFTFQFGYDPAGRDNTKSIAGSKFSVSSIPTTYVIDKEGKIAAAIVGYSDNDKRVEEALKKLGVKID